MHHERLFQPHVFAEMHNELQNILSPDLISLTYEYDPDFPSPWHKIGEVDLYKAKAIHRGHKLFVKSFAPCTVGYADAYFDAMQELATVPFQILMLPIIDLDGKQFLADPIEDTIVSIDEFLESGRNE